MPAQTPADLKPGDEAQGQALMSIKDSCRYLGSTSRANFYANILPLLESVHIGKRHMIVVASMDRLIERLRAEKAV